LSYACIGDGSFRTHKPEFIVKGLVVASPLSLSLSLSLPACDDLDFQLLTLISISISLESLKAQRVKSRPTLISFSLFANYQDEG
jgi:hypothetical protein